VSKTKKPEGIEPAEYSRLLKGLQILSIWVNGFSAERSGEQPKLSTPILGKIKDETSMHMKEDGLAIAKVRYLFNARAEGTRKSFLKIKCEYHLLFETRESLPEAFFKTYSKTSLPLNVWPYFREFVQSTVTRMNMPPITLPLFKR